MSFGRPKMEFVTFSFGILRRHTIISESDVLEGTGNGDNLPILRLSISSLILGEIHICFQLLDFMCSFSSHVALDSTTCA